MLPIEKNCIDQKSTSIVMTSLNGDVKLACLTFNVRLRKAEVATFLHACEGEAVIKLINEKIPYFNAPIYLENKTQIGKVEEIFGPINEVFFSVKMLEGIIATSYKSGDIIFIDPAKLLPLQRFLPQPQGQAGTPSGGGRGGRGRGGRGGGRGGRGFRGRGAAGGRGGSRFRGRSRS
ncbi:hypothetical protein GOP47_0011694 [Adiantum capillus-veneris]|uniref:H/ACA ribonucleoprotein complex subunit n=1 Tax=Adiantum capillus-veneris TaxID=13818 RepID=A0A9D4UTR8_ADICA|nr:hypothetical protein GOP47_0011694 [Adiantum capillus-veneris]